jgi:hypothetical protein
MTKQEKKRVKIAQAVTQRCLEIRIDSEKHHGKQK